MKKVKRYIDVYSVYEYSNLNEESSKGGSWIEGTLTTRCGVVKVYSECTPGSKFLPEISNYTVIRNGRQYTLREHIARSPRGLAIVGKRFAREVAAGKHDIRR